MNENSKFTKIYENKLDLKRIATENDIHDWEWIKLPIVHLRLFESIVVFLFGQKDEFGAGPEERRRK